MKSKPRFLRLLSFPLLLSLLLAGLSPALAQRDDPENIESPESVTIAGTLQSPLGCPGDWNTTCEETMLAYDADSDLWLATFVLEAGSYEYKAALNGAWDDNYGLGAEYYGPNIPLEVAESGPVTFWYDHNTRWVADSVNHSLLSVFGDFQDELGCPADDAPQCLRGLLGDPDGNGVYEHLSAALPPGDYSAAVAQTTGDEDGALESIATESETVAFTVAEGEAVRFAYDLAAGTLTTAAADPAAAQSDAGEAAMPAPAVSTPPELVVIPGTIQSVAGCDEDWVPDCEATALTFDADDDLWVGTFPLPAGEYEYKAALNGTWDVNFGLNAEPGGGNIPLVLEEDRDVTFYFSTQTGWVTEDVSSLIATVAGSFQDDIGCPAEWSPDCLRSWLQDPDGDGTFVFMTDAIPAGAYEAKVAVGQSWDENYGEAGAPGGANIPFEVAEDGTVVSFVWNSGNKIMTIQVGGSAQIGSLAEARAHWLAEDTIVWDIEYNPDNTYAFHFTETGEPLVLDQNGVSGRPITLTYDPDGLSTELAARYPHLADYAVFHLPIRTGNIRVALKGQVAVAATGADDALLDATGLQTAGVIDDIYVYDGPLGVSYEDGAPVLRVWAPTAQRVRLILFDDANPETEAADPVIMRADPESGVWTLAGEPEWDRQYYLYEVTVFAPSTGAVETNLVTDPYSVSLSRNSARSQIVNLDDADLKPEGWDGRTRPPLAAPEDIVVYELHVRDFSAYDNSVPAELRGTYGAFAEGDGAVHLAGLAEAGVTHLHLLPTFDIATINENPAERVEPDRAELAALPPDSDQQQALIAEVRDQDAFNWGYDPLHYNVPEGSYSTDPDGPARIREYRDMVLRLNAMGLRVVADVVYNHTNASGQADNSVLDRIVPGYYHRLSASGRVETSTCCQNTATEHTMMRRLMVDSVRLWAQQYGIDAFRFDLMGHHMKDDMLAVRAALEEIDPSIYVYGEGWDFGEVAGNARGVNATQRNMAGTGIGTFNDRLRDAARGGSPFGGQQEQGFITGLYTDPNETDQGTAEAQLTRLLHLTDLVRVGLAGNLAGYTFTDATGTTVTGADVDYNGQPAGYTADPQENIVYVSKHDNETLFDAIQYKAPASADLAQRVRMQNLGNSLVMLSQGVPFFQAGDDLLRSKSLDRNSYNAGDWFNALDWTGQSTNWGRGLPLAGDNESMWPVMAPLLANPDLTPQPENIAAASAHFREMAALRASSPLFRLPTAEAVQARLSFLNTGPEQTPGVIVMSLSDTVGDNLDPAADRIVVIFNADNDAVTFAAPDWAGRAMALHPVLAASADATVLEATWDADAGTFSVPGRTTAVFVQPEGTEPAATPVPTEEPTVAPTATLAPTTAPTEQPTAAPTATAELVTVAPLPTEEIAQATPAEEAAGQETTEEQPAGNRSAVTAAALLVIAAAAGAAAGVVAWLRSRRVE
jgi:pullulanase-type alpha-1,6-glucosidase